MASKKSAARGQQASAQRRSQIAQLLEQHQSRLERDVYPAVDKLLPNDLRDFDASEFKSRRGQFTAPNSDQAIAVITKSPSESVWNRERLVRYLANDAEQPAGKFAETDVLEKLRVSGHGHAAALKAHLASVVGILNGQIQTDLRERIEAQGGDFDSIVAAINVLSSAVEAEELDRRPKQGSAGRSKTQQIAKLQRWAAVLREAGVESDTAIATIFVKVHRLRNALTPADLDKAMIQSARQALRNAK